MMLSYWETVVIAYVIVIAGIIGLVRFRRIDPDYRPFIYYAWINVINQTLNIYFAKTIGSNTINANIYVLIEAFLFTWLFHKLGTIGRKFYLSILCFLFATWIYDNFIWHQITTVNSFFRVVYSFILIFLAIGHLNKLIVTVKKDILKNASFLICIGMVIFYSYKATVEVFYMVRLQASMSFYENIFNIMVFVSLFVYLIYALAALWIPRKPRFTLQY